MKYKILYIDLFGVHLVHDKTGSRTAGEYTIILPSNTAKIVYYVLYIIDINIVATQVSTKYRLKD